MSHRRRLPGHFCRICKRRRPNEAFSGKGHKTHLCKRCMQRPEAERLRIEQEDELDGYFGQSNVSAKNIARLEGLSGTAQPEIAAYADLIARIADVHPRKRHRLRFLARERRDLLRSSKVPD